MYRVVKPAEKYIPNPRPASDKPRKRPKYKRTATSRKRRQVVSLKYENTPQVKPLTTFDLFLDFPPEIRQHIYSYVFDAIEVVYMIRPGKPVLVERSGSPDTGTKRSDEHHNALLRLSKQCYREATPLYWSHCRFSIIGFVPPPIIFYQGFRAVREPFKITNRPGKRLAQITSRMSWLNVDSSIILSVMDKWIDMSRMKLLSISHAGYKFYETVRFHFEISKQRQLQMLNDKTSMAILGYYVDELYPRYDSFVQRATGNTKLILQGPHMFHVHIQGRGNRHSFSSYTREARFDLRGNTVDVDPLKKGSFI